MNKHALLPTFLVFLLPFLNDIIVFGGSGQTEKIFDAPTGLIGNAVFAVLPFLLIGSAMRPRPRVTRAIWVAAILTIFIWAAYAFTGLKLQSSDEGMALNFYIYMGLMIWPFMAVILMGLIAKFGEAQTEIDLSAGSPDV